MSDTLAMLIACDSIQSTNSDTYARTGFYQYFDAPVFPDIAGFHAWERANWIYYKTVGSVKLIMKNVSIGGADIVGDPQNYTVGSVGRNNYRCYVPNRPYWIDPCFVNKTITRAPAGSRRKTMLLNFMGSNSGGERLVSAHYGLNDISTVNYAAYHAAQMVAAGADINCMATLLPRDDVGFLTEPQRAAFNNLILTPGWKEAHGIHYIFDFGNHPIMGVHANTHNTDYYLTDFTHPSSGGHTLLLNDEIIPKMNQILFDQFGVPLP